MKRITPVFVTLALALVVWSCGGSSTLDNTVASVFLTVDISENNPDIDICTQVGDIWSTAWKSIGDQGSRRARTSAQSGRQPQALGDHSLSHGRWNDGVARSGRTTSRSLSPPADRPASKTTGSTRCGVSERGAAGVSVVRKRRVRSRDRQHQ